MMLRLIYLSLSLLALISCQSSPVAIDYDTQVDFNDFNSYKLEYASPNENSLMQKRLSDSVMQHLPTTGLTAAQPGQTAELIVRPILRSSQRTQEPNSRGGIGIGGGGGNSVFGISLSIPLGSETLVNDIEIEIAILNQQSQKVIWQGNYAFTVNADAPDKTNLLVNEAVQEIFKQYPPDSR